MHAFVWLLIFVASLWVVELADALASLDLDQYRDNPSRHHRAAGDTAAYLPARELRAPVVEHAATDNSGRADFAAREGAAVLGDGVHYAGGRLDGVAGGGSDYGGRRTHRGERGCVWLLWIPVGAGFPRAQFQFDIHSDCGDRVLRRRYSCLGCCLRMSAFRGRGTCSGCWRG